MKRFVKNTLVGLLAAGSFLPLSAQINTPSGATKPFGSNSGYAFGMMPTNLPTAGAYGRSTDAASQYNSWKSSYVELCGANMARVKADWAPETVSEGIAYGMLLSAYAADKDLFNRLWAYYKNFRNVNGVMHWKINGCNSVNQQNGATDAELDAAMALIVANHQWPNTTSPHNYRTDAVALINAIKRHETSNDGTFFNGDFWHPDCRNPSYQAPGYARVFKTFMASNGNADDNFWNNVVTGTERLFANNAHATSGLSTNWCTPQGPPSWSCSGSGTAPDKFGFDACRAPWRQAVDVLWFGSAAASVQNIINRQADFWIRRGGANEVQGGDNMNHDGSGWGYKDGAFIGPIGAQSLAASSSAARQSFCNDMYNRNRSHTSYNYFNKTLQVIGIFVQTGNFWMPGSNTSTNNPPSVSLTSPANNANFNAPASVTISANASDSDGSVSSVSFFNGSTLLGTDNTAPYSFTWNNVPTGSYTLSARATDNQGASSTSGTASIKVNEGNTPPSVNLTAPANNTSLVAPANIVISANASDANGSISSVAFYQGSILLGTDNTAPYTFTWNNVAAGTYSIYARATDNQGASTNSASVSVSVTQTNVNTPPQVTMTAPANGAGFLAPASVVLSANASDADGSVGSVSFYSGTTLLGTDNTAPYNFTWNNLAPGSYSVYARATDNQGASSNSGNVSFTVNNAGTADIIGPDCGIANSTMSFTLNSARRTGATAYNWWYTGSAQSTTTTGFQGTVATGTTFSGGQICVGVNYSNAPWYSSYCKTITVCGARTGEEEIQIKEVTTVSPNPSKEAFFVQSEKTIQSISLRNSTGKEVWFTEPASKEALLQLGVNFANGIYSAQVQYEDGSMELIKIVKTE
ncbi:MAG: glycosyl hydrolase family 8 [Cytophagaceae bacterium]|jgi:endo-1,4-beta-D-glucanase Y|nr:glycosyl hydrolase family 8 [Cytophagaceae bacterium]